MIVKTEPQPQEFTLPFVGREEELQFLLNEYDQMLHAKYRSVWIEAPAGMGKTTLVEEFLKRIDVAHPAKAGCATSPLKPWIVHAHLRERSSNSLASFVEALSSTLQTLSDQQREKLFSGLTSFYRERAKKIVNTSSVQSMDMEEAITTSGYVLKQLSSYFPLVVIIEDIHVLNGELSFYALRHLQAIVEHVPVLTMFISRPSEEKYFRQFQEQVIKEGCKKYEVKSLKYEDVQKLAVGKSEKENKELMHLSGGNALLLRELLRSGDLEISGGIDSTKERIVHYLQKELEKLPKRDRQVIAIAGMLGEEFSEILLQEIAESKDFKCWSNGELERLEHRGIIKRDKKVLKAEGEQKEITLRVSVFSHALWWEAARGFYNKEKTWTDGKFARTIVPLLSLEQYPLLTDGELIAKLFEWLPLRRSIPLILYANVLCGYRARWPFLSPQEHANVLAKAHYCIEQLLHSTWFRINDPLKVAMLDLLNAEFLQLYSQGRTVQVPHENYSLMREIARKFFGQDYTALELTLATVVDEGHVHFFQYGDERWLNKASSFLKSFCIPTNSDHEDELRAYRAALFVAVEANRWWYRKPHYAAHLFNQAIKEIPWNSHTQYDNVRGWLTSILFLEISQREILKNLSLTGKFRTMLKKIFPEGQMPTLESSMCRIEIDLLLRTGNVVQAFQATEELRKLSRGVWRLDQRFYVESTSLSLYAHEAACTQARSVIDRMFSDTFSLLNGGMCFKRIAPSLFLLEEWETFDRLWKKYKDSLVPYSLPLILPLLEMRMLMCLLHGDNVGEEAVMKQMKHLRRHYPVTDPAVKRSLAKMEIFQRLKTKSLAIAKKRFEKFLATNDTLSPFDKAHYSQLFARIAVKQGHDPKHVVSYAHDSLKGFEKLELPKRVLFTAQKLAEVDLIAQKELQKFVKKYSVHESRVPNPEPRIPSPEHRTTMNGITLHCLGQIRATDPSGKEIIGRRWGKRKSAPSLHKQIILDFIQAKMEGRPLSGAELLSSLYPEMRRRELSPKKLFRLKRRLSVFLPQLKNSFLPYAVIEKIGENYELHPSVHVDIITVKENIAQAIVLINTHKPSAKKLLYDALALIEKGDCAQGMNGTTVKTLRKVREELRQKTQHLLVQLSKEEVL